MTYKIKINDRSLSINLMHNSVIDFGVFTVKATTHTFLFEAKDTDWGADINETEMEFYVNDKRCKYVGFKQLYNQLHGDGSFVKFEADIIRQIEEVVAKQIVKEYPGTDVNF
jgi:hypothetical protein